MNCCGKVLQHVIICKAVIQPNFCVKHGPLAQRKPVTVDGKGSLRKHCWSLFFASCWFPSFAWKGLKGASAGSPRERWRVASGSFACRYLYDAASLDATAACPKQVLDKSVKANTPPHKGASSLGAKASPFLSCAKTSAPRWLSLGRVVFGTKK